MPPKPKYTREEIIDAAFELVRENGIESLAARELGKRMGTSSSPIFTAFKNMEELQQEIRAKALQEFESCISDALNYTPAFKHVGEKMIEFAAREPKLFQLIYMQEHEESKLYMDYIREELGETVEVCITVMQKDYALSREDAEKLFAQTWMHTFAICVLVAGKVCHFTQDEISEMLSREFQGALMLIKTGGFKVIPVKPPHGE